MGGLHNHTWGQHPPKILPILNETILKNQIFELLLCTKINFEPKLTLLPKLSEAPYPLRVLYNGFKKVLRHVWSGLKGVEKLEFWAGFEPQILSKTKKLAMNSKIR